MHQVCAVTTERSASHTLWRSPRLRVAGRRRARRWVACAVGGGDLTWSDVSSPAAARRATAHASLSDSTGKWRHVKGFFLW